MNMPIVDQSPQKSPSVHACTLRAPTLAWPPDIRIKCFQLESLFYERNKNVSKKWNLENFLRVHVQACTHAPCVHRPLHGPLTLEFNFFNWNHYSMRGTKNVSMKWNLENFLRVHACTHLACRNPCTAPWYWNLMFSTDIVYFLTGQTRLVEKKNIYRRACSHAPCMPGPLHGPWHWISFVSAEHLLNSLLLQISLQWPMHT